MFLNLDFISLSLIISILALVWASWTAWKIKSIPVDNKKAQEIANAIKEGAMAFLSREYRPLAIFVAAVGAILYFFIGQNTAFAFLFGSILSALAGNIGMRIATIANVRTALACKKNISKGLSVAFSSGLVMGLSVVGLGLLGVIILYLLYRDPNIIFGFGFGASSIALFARVGGGIYTKAADVGADLVGKVEKNIPEDDPRNPAVIADNVGDNVGDVAGMGADLFESYVDAIAAAMILGAVVFVASEVGVILPLLIAAVGIISSIAGSFLVRARSSSDASAALNRGIIASSVLAAGLMAIVIQQLTGNLDLFWATLTGLVAGIVIGLSTEFFTSAHSKTVKGIVEASKTGPATNIISGLSVGMMSTIVPVAAIAVSILVAYHFGGLYGIALAAVGMLSTLGITLATDAYGPVVDNAAGIAEMAGLGKQTRERAESLDAIGNTTAAIGKGFAIGSAALTALALFASFIAITGVKVINIGEPRVIVGLFIGAMLVFVFSALTMGAVGRAAGKMVEEVRHQFKTIKGLMEGTARPNYERAVGISTEAALSEMVLPAAIAIVAPVAVGLTLGAQALGGLLAGTLSTGFLVAVFMANSGGAWDNAKKFVEEGNFGGKGSDVHKATVVGDTVGDPFKDTSGPSLNILIKLISIVALVFVPLFL